MQHSKHKIAVIGKSGQLAWELAQNKNANLVCLGRDDINILSKSSIKEKLDAIGPTAVINASAYTAVDKAETDKQAAFDLNCTAVENLAQYCKTNNAFMVHISTDYVFEGSKGAPYVVNDAIAPQGVYGESKAKGEAALTAILANSSAILRTSWVYASHGNNFVKTMLRLMAQKPELNVIDDQVGSPTWAKGLADAALEAATQKHVGIFHWSDEGITSWYDFACAIQTLGIQKGLLKQAIPIHPIPTSDYPTPAKRPHYSVLDKSVTRSTFSTPLTHWQTQLSCMLDQLK